MRVRIGFALLLWFGVASFAGSANAALVISSAATSNVNCSGGVCTATAADAVLNVKDLRAILQHGPLTIISGPDAQDIEIDRKFTWTQRHHLTLDAFRSILFREAAISEARSAVTLITNDGGSGGDYSFTDKGHISFWDTRSQLVINGKTFTLVNDIATLASDIAANPSGAYALARGYDASVDGSYTSPPVSTTLEGSFEGLGHEITNLSIAAKNKIQRVGLFADLGLQGTIRDIKLSNATVTTSTSNAFFAALVGWSDGTITNSMTTGKLTGTVGNRGQITGGGIAGNNDGVVSKSSSECFVRGVTVGTLVGNNSGTIADSHGTGMGYSLVGSNTGTINRSYMTNVIAPKGLDAPGVLYPGGLLAVFNSGTISQSFATGTVSGRGFFNEGGDYEADVGGLVATNSGKITQSYANVAASGYVAYIGGLVGSSYGSITESYSVGPVTKNDTYSFSGGLIGTDDAPPNSNVDTYWDLDTSGTDSGTGNDANDPGIIGLTDAQFKAGLPAGFDPQVWGQSPSINNGYPYLLANPPPQ